MGTGADLLSALADIEEDEGRVETALGHMAKAVALDPHNPELLADCARMQLRAGLLWEAPGTMTEMPDEPADQWSLRPARTDAYRSAKLYVLAADADGRRSGLRWPTGGPIRPLKGLMRRFDERVLATGRRWSHNVDALHVLAAEPVPPHSTQVRADVDASNLAWARQHHSVAALRKLHDHLQNDRGTVRRTASAGRAGRVSSPLFAPWRWPPCRWVP
jgi:hypothetical protein